MKVEYNLTGLTDIDDESGEFINDMLKLFVQNLYEGNEEIKRFASESKWDMVNEKVHQMLGPCRHLSVEPLTQTLKKLMDSVEASHGNETLIQLVAQLETEISHTITEFRKLIKD